MDRNERSRRQQSGAANPAARKNAQKKPRSLGSRVGLKREATPPPQRQRPPKASAQQPQGQPRQQRPQPQAQRPRQQNPQKPGYRQGAPLQRRRITQAEQLRIRRNRAIFGAVCVLVVLIIGMILSVNLLFKITDFRVENTDRTTPANTGIYTEQQIIDLTGLQTGDNLFGFSTGKLSAQMLAQLPYLEELAVNVQMPGTVVIKVRPATERFILQSGSTWLVLSDKLKVLRSDSAQPEGLILLEAPLAAGQATSPGSFLTLETYNSLDDDATQATGETALNTANEALTAIISNLEAYGLLDAASVISLEDMSELNFLYQGRVSVKLGTANNLEYKIRLAAQIINDPEKGLGASDRGTLDVSYQRSDGEIWGYFQPAEATPAPETKPAENDAETAENEATE